jgi:tetratricopeptide (TPR) repeat protein
VSRLNILNSLAVAGSLATVLFTGACAAPEPTAHEAESESIGIAHPTSEALEPALAIAIETRRTNLEILRAGDPSPADLGRAFGELGRLYQAHRLLEAALGCYREAHRLDPEAFAWAYYLGVLAASNGDVEDSAQAFEQALKLRPGDLPSLIRLADIELERSNPEEARGFYQRAAELNPALAVAEYGLGRVAVARENPKLAIEHFGKALAIQPDASVIHYNLGQAYRQLGELETAQIHLSRSGKVRVAMADPLMHELTSLAVGAGPHLSRGNAAIRDGRLAEAISEYRLAVAADPNSAKAHLSLGSALARSGDLDGAAAEFKAAVLLEPSARAHSDLGVVLGELGEDELSLQHLRRAIELEPELVKAQLNLANALARLGHHEEAVAVYRRGLQDDPSNVQAHFTLADLLVQVANLEEAAIHYRRTRELEPALGPAWIREATILMGMGRYAEARSVLIERLATDSTDEPAAHSLARLLASAPDHSLRQGPQALEIAAKLLEANNAPQNAETAAMALAEVGRFKEALQIQRALVAEAKRLGRSGDQSRLTRNLALYEQGTACCARPADTLPPY